MKGPRRTKTEKVHSWKLIRPDILGENVSARRLSTRERREESEMTTRAIGSHVQRESHHIDGVRAKS